MSRRKGDVSRAERTEEIGQTVLDAALDLYLEQGYEKTTIRQILEKAGIKNGSLYNIYRGKEEIFADLGFNIMSDALRFQEECLEQDAPLEDRFCFIPCIQIYASCGSPASPSS